MRTGPLYDRPISDAEASSITFRYEPYNLLRKSYHLHRTFRFLLSAPQLYHNLPILSSIIFLLFVVAHLCFSQPHNGVVSIEAICQIRRVDNSCKICFNIAYTALSLIAFSIPTLDYIELF